MRKLIAAAMFASIASLAAHAAAESGQPMTGAEIRAAFTGKTLEYRTNRRPVGGDPNRPTAWERRPDGGYVVNTIQLRDDGSALVRCRGFDGRGNPQICRLGAGGGDVGVWSVSDNALCTAWTVIRSGEYSCFAITREGNAYRYRQVSGVPSGADGELFEVR